MTTTAPEPLTDQDDTDPSTPATRLMRAAAAKHAADAEGHPEPQRTIMLATVGVLRAEAMTRELVEPAMELLSFALQQSGMEGATMSVRRREDGELDMDVDTSPAVLRLARAILELPEDVPLT